MKNLKLKFLKGLESIGIKKNDIIFCHSSLFLFNISNKMEAKKLCSLIYKCIKNKIGENGTLIVPTFTYSISSGQQYDYKNSKNICGIFSEYVRKKKSTKIYIDPNVSVAANGGLAEYFTKKPTKNSYCKNSFFDRFVKKKGKICNINLDSGSTFIHYFERKLKVNYRYDKTFFGYSGKKKISSTLYVRKLKEDYQPDFRKFHNEAIKGKYYKKFYLEKSYVGVINIENVEMIINKNFKKNKSFLILGKND